MPRRRAATAPAALLAPVVLCAALVPACRSRRTPTRDEAFHTLERAIAGAPELRGALCGGGPGELRGFALRSAEFHPPGWFGPPEPEVVAVVEVSVQAPGATALVRCRGTVAGRMRFEGMQAAGPSPRRYYSYTGAPRALWTAQDLRVRAHEPASTP